MFGGAGTVVNVLAIISGSVIGMLAGHRIKSDIRALMTDVLGAVTLISAASAIKEMWSSSLNSLPTGAPILIVLASLLVGGLIGSLLTFEARLDGFGQTLKAKFDRGNSSRFVEGFVTSSLIFVIGPLAILGSISDGMGTGVDQLLLKSALDFFASIAFAATFGWGVSLSSLPVGIYQFSWTFVGVFLGSVLSDTQVALMTATGGILLLGIALKLLEIKKIAIGNLLPALAITPCLVALVQKLN